MHYVKAMMRDKVGSYMARGDWERFLNTWVSRYVLVHDQASPAIRATRPLREARIDVSEDKGKAGRYRLVAYLRPHVQLDELSSLCESSGTSRSRYQYPSRNIVLGLAAHSMLLPHKQHFRRPNRYA
jgi:EvpB/VC_A0108, tail sheath gpW/gp25-like domain